MTSAIPRRHDEAADLYECTSCSQMLPRADFSKHRHCLYGLNPTCRLCSRLKAQKHWAETREALRAKRAALAPVAVTPKPKPAPAQRPLSKDAARMQSHKPPATYPQDDPAACVFLGSPCEAQTGFALIRELFAANCCMGVVRGFAATVDQNETGIVRPRFAREASWHLWNSMILSRCGATAERMAA